MIESEAPELSFELLDPDGVCDVVRVGSGN